MNTSENEPKNLGQLKTSAGFIGNSMKANFKTVTPVKPLRIFITAEDIATATTPSSQIVLSTANFD
jgi:hypothetical protein